MKRILTMMVGLLCMTAMNAQTPLQNDPAVKVGKLDNGMTYYIRHNEKPAQRAEFYLATNVGAIQEAPDQDGLAHFLEHMCFNGLKNLPGKTMLEYLQHIGAEFGRNINASTGVETTQYMLNNIPVIREGIIDTCLLVMHDYSHFVTCDPVEIDNERGVILEERRTRRTADWRMSEKARPLYYGNTKYATCTVIGSKENLETFKPESLVNFYQTWYRPDNQALIVVGDIDVDQIEAKIKALFADIPAPVNPKAKDVIIIPDNDEPMVGVITDPEATATGVSILWRHPSIPEAMNNTAEVMLLNLQKRVLSLVMSERLEDITSKPGAPFLGASFGTGRLMETCEAAIGSVSSREGEALSSFTAFMMEVEKLVRYGITDAELGRAKDNILAAYEKNVQGAESRTNSSFVRPMISNFFDNSPYLEPSYAFDVVKQLLPMISVQSVNGVVKHYVSDKNISIICEAPEKEGVALPTEKELVEVLATVKNAQIEANAAEQTGAELLNAKSLKGSKSKKASKGAYGSTVWTLKNGVKVVVLPTDYKKDQVMIRLRKDGGRSLIATDELASFEENVWELFQSNSGLCQFSSRELEKMMAGNTATAGAFIGGLSHGVSASCAPKDIETAFQLLYMSYVNDRFQQDEFQVGMDQIRAVLPNMLNNPSFKLQQRIPATIYGNNPRRFALSEEVLDKASVETIQKVYRRLFSDVAGATLYIIGNTDVATVKPLVEKYVGSLPKGKKASKWVDNNEDIVKGAVDDFFAVDMQTPKCTALEVFTAELPYTVQRDVELKAAKYILDMIYTETLREQEGGTYGASVGASCAEFPKGRAMIQVYFDTNPSSVDKLMDLAVQGVEKLANEGPTAEQMTRTIENFKKNIPEKRIQNSYWLSCLTEYYQEGRDYDAQYEAAVGALTAEGIQKAVKEILEQGNLIRIKMSPANAAEAE